MTRGSFARLSCLVVLAAALAGCATAPSVAHDVPATAGTPIDVAAYNREIRRQGMAHYCGKGTCDSLPTLLVAYAPAYPAAELNAGVDGNASIVFYITEDGSLADFKVVSASADVFAKAAIDALKQWRFDPSKLKGKPIRTQGRQDFPFVAR